MRKSRRYEPERAVVYGRQSRTTEGSTSREDQVVACTAEAGRRGLEVVEVILEPPSTSAFRGRGKNRPEWPRLLELVRLRKVEVVVALKTDRLSRGGGPGWAPLLEAAEEAGLDTDRLVLIAGSGYVSEFELGVRAAMDQEESRKGSDRIAISKERNAMEGKFHGGRRCYGYTADGMTVIDEEADEVRSLARRYLAGESINSIVVELNKRAVPTASGKLWTTTGLRLVLTSARVAGYRQYGWETGDDGRPNKRRPVIVGDAAWPAILDRDDWTRIKAKFNGNAHGRTNDPMYLLTGIAQCWRCGKGLNGLQVNRPGGRRVRIYQCQKKPDGTGCAGVSLPADGLDDYVTARVLKMAVSQSFMARLRRNAGDNETARRAKARKELLAAEADLEQKRIDYADGVLSRESWMVIGPRAETRVTNARVRLERITVSRRVLPEALDRPDELPGCWGDMTPGQRRTVLSAMVDHLVVGPGLVDGRQVKPADRVTPEFGGSIRWRA